MIEEGEDEVVQLQEDIDDLLYDDGTPSSEAMRFVLGLEKYVHVASEVEENTGSGSEDLTTNTAFYFSSSDPVVVSTSELSQQVQTFLGELGG